MIAATGVEFVATIVATRLHPREPGWIEFAVRQVLRGTPDWDRGNSDTRQRLPRKQACRHGTMNSTTKTKRFLTLPVALFVPSAYPD
jgi:hypothetical protein